jgi:MFS family permease
LVPVSRNLSGDRVTQRERRGWLVVISLFVTLFFVFGGGYNTAGVFFAPMRKFFGWSSAQQSSLQTILALTAGVSVPLFGWMLDKVEARFVMTGGIVVAGCSLLLASHANSFATLVVAYVGLGIAIASATLLPTEIVIANWFENRRGAALGFATAGTSLGGLAMMLFASHAVGAAGWRAGYVVLAVPTFFVAAPLVMLLVRTRPPDQASSTSAANPLAGLDLGPALHSRSFWMLAAAQFLFSLAGAGATVHSIPYLIRQGFNPAWAAEVFSITFGLASAGKLLMGLSADKISGRIALAIALALNAVGQFLLLYAHNQLILAGYVLLFGTMSGAPLALFPMVIADSFGLKNFGTITGLTGICITLGGAIGPILGGVIVDRGFGYSLVFELFSAALIAGSLAALACSPLEPAPQSDRLRV